MFNSKASVMRAFLSIVVVAAAVAASYGQDGGGKDESAFKDVSLPKGTEVLPRSLWVSADHRFVLYGIRTDTSKVRGLIETDVRIIDTKSGKTASLYELLPKNLKSRFFTAVTISPNSNKVLFTFFKTQSMPEPPMVMLDLEKSRCSEFKVNGSRVIRACWAGDRIVCTTAKDDCVGEIVLYSPGKAAIRTGVFGWPVSAGKGGELLLVTANPDSMATAPQLRDEEKAVPMLINAKGELLCRVDEAKNMSQPPVFSAGGKYLAFQCHDEQTYYAKVFCVESMTAARINDPQFVLGVTDEGEALTCKKFFNRTAGNPMYLWNKECTGHDTLAEKAGSSILVGDTAFYVVPCDDPVVKAVKFKRPEPPIK